MRPHVLSAALLGTLASACLIDDADDDFAQLIDRALDESEVTLVDAVAVPNRRFRDATLVAGEIDPFTLVYGADLWTGSSLLHVTMGLDGEVIDVDAFGSSEWAADSAALVESAEITLFDAIVIAEDVVEGSRAFEVVVAAPWFHVDVLGDLGVYAVWIDPRDGQIVKVVLAVDFSNHGHCPQVCF